MPLYPVPDLFPALPEMFLVTAAMALLMVGVFRGDGAARLVSWLAVGALAIAMFMVLDIGGARQVSLHGGLAEQSRSTRLGGE